jgi:hypothetical protein
MFRSVQVRVSKSVPVLKFRANGLYCKDCNSLLDYRLEQYEYSLESVGTELSGFGKFVDQICFH